MSGEREAAGGPLRSEIDRAQTPIDFAVGAGVFLLTLAFVIAFVPTLFDPFSAAETASPVVSDRVAAGIAGDLLAASPSEPGVLSPTCTVAFFPSASNPPTDDCRFEPGDDPADIFGIDGNVQVIIHELDETNPGGNPVTVAEVATSAGTFENVRLIYPEDGPSGTAADDVTISQRLVSIDGDQYRLTVRVW